MKYQELNLKKIREDNGLDFAHFTYLRNMCSCCSTPLEFPARYWHKGIKPTSMDNAQYLIFKNADNGSGRVTRTEDIKDYQSIAWQFPEKKLLKICKDIQDQMGNEYVVLIPKSKYFCILAIKRERTELIESEVKQGYRKLEDTIISPKMFAERVQQIVQEEGDDYEAAHARLDELLCQTLEQNGYSDGISIYKKAPKW